MTGLTSAGTRVPADPCQAALLAVAEAAATGEMQCPDELLARIRAALGSTTAPRLLSYSEAGEVLGVCGDTVRRHVASGDLAAVRLGYRTVRVSAVELARYVQAHASRASPVVAHPGVD